MHILWINHRDPQHPQAGGAEVRIREVARRLVRMGHRVTLLSEKINGSPGKVVIEGVEVRRIGGRATIHILAPLYVRWHQNEYDVVIDDIAHAMPWYSPLATRKPVIAQVHHLHQDVVCRELSRPLASIIAWAERTIAKVYNHIIAISPSTRQELIERLGMKPERITVIPNGVDVNKYRPGPKDSRPTVLWVGRIKRYKNLDHLLKAYKQVKKEEPDTQLVIIGTGGHEESIKKLAKKLELEDVHFLGRVTEKEKVRWMQRSWIITSTSAKEGWGISVLEAAACGTPTVAYDVAGLRDSVKNMETGLLVPFNNINALSDAITNILVDDGLRNRISRGAREWATHFSWERTAEKALNAIEYVMDCYNKERDVK
jgi:glycosyltransferase involved in cell wall biosynthesis